MSDENVIDFAAAKAALKKAEVAAAREKAKASVVEEPWEGALLFGDKGCVDPKSGANVTMILTHHIAWRDAFRYDVFAGRIIVAKDCPAGLAGSEWCDHHDKLTADWLERSKYALRPGKGTVFDSVNAVARIREVHPVREYLQALTWDGKPRVNLFAAKYLGARPGKGEGQKARYLARVSAILLIGPVARIMRPGCLLKTVPILEGPQDLGKSTAVRALCPRPEWFSDSEIPYGSKDAFQGLRGKWLIELAEIDKDLKGRHSASAIKAFISSPSDYYRDSYGRRFADNPRQGAFIGSTNHDEYLTDETGGSRFLPFVCGRPDVEAIVRDRDQLWAEAYRRFVDGEPWWLDQSGVLAYARTEQAARLAPDVWSPRIEQVLEGALPADGVTTDWILGSLGLLAKDQGVSDQMRVAKVMAALGWKNTRKMRAGRRQHRWEKACPP